MLNFDLEFYIFGVHSKKMHLGNLFHLSIIIVFFVALLFLNILHYNDNSFIKKGDMLYDSGC